MTPLIQRLQAFAQHEQDQGEWRMLEPGTLIEAEDEISGNGTDWSPVKDYSYVIGCHVGPTQHGAYRRRVAPVVPKPVQDTEIQGKREPDGIPCDCGADLLATLKRISRYMDGQEIWDHGCLTADASDAAITCAKLARAVIAKAENHAAK
jgi:hypothetical protein